MLKPIYLILALLTVVSCNKDSIDSRIHEVKTLQDIAKNNVNDSTLIYLDQAKKIIDHTPKIPDSLRIENRFRRGYYFKQINELDSASYYFHRTIDLINKPNDRNRNRVYFQNTWETDESNNDLSNAISVAQKFIDLSNSKTDSDDLVFAYNYLERVNLDLGNYKNALYYNSKTSDAAKQSSNLSMYVITGTSKAQTLYHFLNKKEAAFKLLDSLRVLKVDKNATMQLHRTYGILNYYEEDYDAAIKNFKSALNFAKAIEYNYNYNLLESYNNLADTYLAVENYELMRRYLDSSKTVITANSFPEYITFYNELRFRYNYRTKNNEDILLGEYLALIEDNKKQHQEKIDEELIALKLANEKEAIAIDQKNKAEINNIKLLSLLGFAALLLMIGFLFYRQRRFNFEKQELQMQQRLLRSQMNPHFMFNTLSVIQKLVKDNQESATNYLLKFSRLLRLILENSLNNYVQIENELESLRKYLDLQLLRFPKAFDYDIVLENLEEDELLYIPPMLIQPFVENSIEHGFSGIDYKGHIDIKLVLKNKWIHCTIEDNGVGFKHVSKDYKESVSTQLISKFVYKMTKRRIVFSDKKIDNPSASGVLISFLMPYKLSPYD